MRAHDPQKAQDRAKPYVSAARAPRAATDPAMLAQGTGLTPGAVTALQRTAGNGAVSRALRREAHRHSADRGHATQTTERMTGSAAPIAGALGTAAGRPTPVQRAATVQRARTAPARMDGDRLLDAIVGHNRTLAGFQFGPESRNNGGSNLISRPVEVRVPDGTRTVVLAVHLNVVLKTGGEVTDPGRSSSSVTIDGSLCHLTARLASSQSTIDSHGPSRLTAEASIHVGRSNAARGWGNNPQNTRALAEGAGIPAEQLVAALERRFPPADVAGIVERFKKDAGRVVIHALPHEVVHVNWKGDSSFA